MMTRPRLAAIAVLCLSLAACKIEIDVPTSGNVTTSSDTINCAAGATCTVDVSDIYFDETFVAEPAQGFVFEGWKKKSRGLCGGDENSCHLYTSSFEGNDYLSAFLENPDEVFYLEPVFRSTGFNLLGIGHSFFRPFMDAMPNMAAQVGIPNHTQSKFTAGGANGAPQAWWQNASRRSAIQAVLDTGNVELFGMTYEPTYPTTQGYENWIDYALSKNPDTRFFVALPWLDRPENYDTQTYANAWLGYHSTAWHAFIDTLRALYPGVDIYCIPYGQSALELRNLFAAGSLPDVSVLTGATSQAIFIDSKGHAGDTLKDLGRLVWMNAIYGVDLENDSLDPGYSVDLQAIAKQIMDAHDPAYNAPYH